MQPVTKIEIYKMENGETVVKGPLAGPCGKALCVGLLLEAIDEVKKYVPPEPAAIEIASAMPSFNGHVRRS